jgi:hypothetical protein
MIIQPGEIWIADIPFTTAKVSKKRPVLVLWLDGADVIVAAVTSAGGRYQLMCLSWIGKCQDCEFRPRFACRDSIAWNDRCY